MTFFDYSLLFIGLFLFLLGFLGLKKNYVNTDEKFIEMNSLSKKVFYSEQKKMSLKWKKSLVGSQKIIILSLETVFISFLFYSVLSIGMSTIMSKAPSNKFWFSLCIAIPIGIIYNFLSSKYLFKYLYENKHLSKYIYIPKKKEIYQRSLFKMILTLGVGILIYICFLK